MAATRSLKATQDGIDKIQKALTTKKLGREKLAELADNAARSTANNFCTGKPTDRKYFVQFCELLDLDWAIISGNAAEEKPKASPSTSIEIDTLVHNLRDAGRADIQSRCGTMRVLDMTQPIDTNSIYTDVNILEKVTGKTRAEINQLMQGYNPENFNRFFLGNVRHERVDGLEAISRHNLLMILGRPGAGKTTFLKRLAILCSLGERFADRVPIFVTLREFADNEDKSSLLNFISKTETMQQVLYEGRSVILLDGLDEVQDAEQDRILSEIRNFVRYYDKNLIIITCRIAAREYIFEQFTEVEIADFNQEQITDFVTKWFLAKNPQQATQFLGGIEMNKPVKELATNPLLLTLLCLEFEEASDFPASRAELYQRGLNVLLTKWDGQRGIKRDAVYRRLSTKRKESLLGQLAMHTFEKGDYFFKQAVAEQQISQYIQNLPNANIDQEALLIDSHTVLKSIEFQHGLLTERATEIYSFSHLTFHEYFVAKHLVEHPERETILKSVIKYVPDKYWREIFLLLAEQLEPADTLLISIKLFIEDSVFNDIKIQEYLNWLNTKSSSTQTKYKAASLRAYYFQLSRFMNDFSSNIDMSYNFLFDLACDIDDELDWDIWYKYADEEEEEEEENLPELKELKNIVMFGTELDCELSTDLCLAIILRFSVDIENNDCSDKAMDYTMFFFLVRSELLAHKTELKINLNTLKKKFIKLCGEDFEHFDHFYKTDVYQWANQLRQVMIAYCNIGHDWNFTDEQKQNLHKYYDANKLLVDCLNSECYVSRSVREEIEETLFLPIAEIEKWKQAHRPS